MGYFYPFLFIRFQLSTLSEEKPVFLNPDNQTKLLWAGILGNAIKFPTISRYTVLPFFWSVTLPGRRPTKTMKSSKNCRTSSFQVFPGSLRTQRYFLISKTFCLIFYQFVERCFPNNYSILLRVQGSRDTSRSLSCDSGRSSLYTQMKFINSNIGTLVKICNIY